MKLERGGTKLDGKRQPFASAISVHDTSGVTRETRDATWEREIGAISAAAGSLEPFATSTKPHPRYLSHMCRRAIRSLGKSAALGATQRLR